MNLKVVILSVAMVFVGAYGSFAQEQEHAEHGTEAAVAATAETGTQAAVEVGNKFCPVSKEKVGEMGEVVKYEYNGKIYNLCCPMCKKDFAKDPEKYSRIAEEEAAAGQNQPAKVR